MAGEASVRRWLLVSEAERLCKDMASISEDAHGRPEVTARETGGQKAQEEDGGLKHSRFSGRGAEGLSREKKACVGKMPRTVARAPLAPGFSGCKWASFILSQEQSPPLL